CLDLLLDAGKIRSLFRNNKTFSCMFLSCSQFGILAPAHRLQSRLHRDRILFAILHTFNPADSVRMTLAYAFAPESIIFAVGENRIGIHSVQREHSGIPAYGDNAYMSAFCRSTIHIIEMLRNPG